MSGNQDIFRDILSAKRTGVRVEDFVVDQLREAISRGALTPGTSVPSTDQLAQMMGANLNAVNRGLSRLAAEGYLNRKRKAGTTIQLPGKEKRRIYLLVGQDLKSECNHTSRYIARTLEEDLDRRGFEVRILGDLNAISKMDREEQQASLSQVISEFTAFPPSGFITIYFAMERLAGLQKYFGVPRASWALAKTDDIVLQVEDIITQGIPFLRGKGVRRLAMFIHATYLRPHVPLYRQFWDTLEANKIACVEMIEIFGANTNLELEISAYENARALFAEWRKVGGRKLPCDGLLITDDIVMRGVAMALREARIRVPEDMRVLTFANRGIDHHYNLSVDRFEMPLSQAAEALGDRMEERLFSPTRVLPQKVVEGEIVPFDIAAKFTQAAHHHQPPTD